MRIRHPLRWILTGFPLFAGGTGCIDSTTTEGGTPVASLMANPVLPSALSTASFALDVDRVRMLLIRPPSELILDTTVFFPADSNQLTIRVRVPLALPQERLSLAMELRAGKRLLFAGTESFDVAEGRTIAPIVPLQYVGPGSELTSLAIGPRDSVLKPGDTFTFSVQAFQGSRTVDSFYVGWGTSEPQAVPVDARGTLTAPAARGSVRLRVVAPTGIKDSTTVWFSPPPTTLTRVSGDGQYGEVGLPLKEPLAVRVTAADQLGVPGIRVRFQAPFGSRVQDTLVVTNAEGYASTTAILGPIPSLYTFDARTSLLGPVTFQAIGTPGPPTAIIRGTGDGQVAPVGRPLAPFVVRVVDRFGNAVAGVEVAWEVISGGGTLAAPVSTTDLGGSTQMTYTLGTLPGQNVVRARIPAGASVQFTATGIPQ